MTERMDNGNFRSMFQRERADWRRFEEHGFTRPIKRRLKRVSDDVIGEAVAF